MALSQEQIKNLKEGQNLRMTTFFGLGRYHLDAKVEVVTISTAGCLVRVTEILSMGEDNTLFEGKRLVCAFEELKTIPE